MVTYVNAIETKIKLYFNFLSLSFRGWEDYVEGFGDIEGNYWLGLRDLAKILHTGVFELFVYLEPFEPDNAAFARYAEFNVRSLLKIHMMDILDA